MTRRRGQKRKIRAQMARTGETYSTARARLLDRARATLSDAPVVMIPVTDMSRAIRFYEDELGLELKTRNGDDSWAEFRSGDARIGLHAGAAAVGINTGLVLIIPDLDEPLRVVHDPDGNAVVLMRQSSGEASLGNAATSSSLPP